MLVLGRKKGESIEILDKETGEVVCTMFVLHVSYKNVRLGFDAPSRYQFVRGEIVRGEIAGEFEGGQGE